MSYETKLEEIKSAQKDSSADTVVSDAPDAGHEEVREEPKANPEGSENTPNDEPPKGGNRPQWSDAEKEAHGLRKRLEKMYQRQEQMQRRLEELQGGKKTEQVARKTRKDFSSDDEYIDYIRKSSMDEIASSVYDRYEKQMSERSANEQAQREFAERIQKELRPEIVEKVASVLNDPMSEQMELLQTKFGEVLQDKIGKSPIGSHILGLFAMKPHIFTEMANAAESEWPMKLALLEHDMQRMQQRAGAMKKETEQKAEEAQKRAESVPVTGGFGQGNGSIGEKLENMNQAERIAKLKAMYRQKR